MKKPGLAAAAESLAKKSPRESSPEIEVDDDDEEMDEYSTSVDELFDALKSNDRDAFKEAFRAAVGGCK